MEACPECEGEGLVEPPDGLGAEDRLWASAGTWIAEKTVICPTCDGTGVVDAE